MPQLCFGNYSTQQGLIWKYLLVFFVYREWVKLVLSGNPNEASSSLSEAITLGNLRADTVEDFIHVNIFFKNDDLPVTRRQLQIWIVNSTVNLQLSSETFCSICFINLNETFCLANSHNSDFKIRLGPFLFASFWSAFCFFFWCQMIVSAGEKVRSEWYRRWFLEAPLISELLLKKSRRNSNEYVHINLHI